MKTQKKNPTIEQLNDFRHMLATAATCADYDRLNAFIDEYNVHTQVYEDKGKKGVKDSAGRVLVPAEYDEVGYTFMDHVMPHAVPVQKGEFLALAAQDGKGTLLSGFEYDAIHYTPECCYILMKDGKEGIATSGGKIVVPAQMDQIYTPLNGLASFEKDGKCGFSMVYEGITTDAVYDEYRIDCDSYLEVMKNGIRGFIDSKGDFTTDEDEAYFSTFCD